MARFPLPPAISISRAPPSGSVRVSVTTGSGARRSVLVTVAWNSNTSDGDPTPGSTNAPLTLRPSATTPSRGVTSTRRVLAVDLPRSSAMRRWTGWVPASPTTGRIVSTSSTISSLPGSEAVSKDTVVGSPSGSDEYAARSMEPSLSSSISRIGS